MQGKCLVSSDGSKWMYMFDSFHPAIRRALCNCEINICAACFETFAANEDIDLYTLPSLPKVHDLIQRFITGAADNDHAERTRRQNESRMPERFSVVYLSPNDSATTFNNPFYRTQRDLGGALERSIYGRAFIRTGFDLCDDVGEDVWIPKEIILRKF